MSADDTAEDTPTVPAPTGDAPAGEAATAASGGISRSRRIWVNVLIVVTTLLAIVGMLSVWMNRLLMNPDNWSSTSTQLLQNSDIRSATSNYIVDQVYANVDVASVLKSGLPTQFQGLAAPAAGALQNAAVQGVDLLLTRPRVQNLWAEANKAADQAFVTIVNGGKGPVGVKQGAVTLNLAAIVNNVAARLGLPSGLGSKLPASIGNLVIFKSNQLKLLQDIGSAIKSLALWLTILVPLLYALAIFLARGRRRRTLMSVGLAGVIAGLIGLAARSIVESAITNSLVQDASIKPAVRATIGIATQILATIAGAFILVGVVLVIAAWFAGPARPAVAARRAIAPFLRENPVGTFGIVIGIMVLVFVIDPIPATGTPVGIVVFLAMALFGTEMLRRQTAEEFPDARLGEATAAMRARWQSYRDRRAGGPAAPAPAAADTTLPEQLERLTKLRDQGALTPEEYESAKSNLLHA
jgi:hypothetical protein